MVVILARFKDDPPKPEVQKEQVSTCRIEPFAEAKHVGVKLPRESVPSSQG